MLLLDTNVLVKLSHPEKKDQVLPYLRQETDDTWVTSSLVVFEFFRPAQRRQQIPQVQAWLGSVLDGIEPLDESAAMQAVQVEASLTEQGTSLAMRDLLIASHARDVGAIFVTMDRADFEDRAVQDLLNVDVITSD